MYFLGLWHFCSHSILSYLAYLTDLMAGSRSMEFWGRGPQTAFVYDTLDAFWLCLSQHWAYGSLVCGSRSGTVLRAGPGLRWGSQSSQCELGPDTGIRLGSAFACSPLPHWWLCFWVTWQDSMVGACVWSSVSLVLSCSLLPTECISEAFRGLKATTWGGEEKPRWEGWVIWTQRGE